MIVKSLNEKANEIEIDINNKLESIRTITQEATQEQIDLLREITLLGGIKTVCRADFFIDIFYKMASRGDTINEICEYALNLKKELI
jgi:hypothetical protein